MCNVSAQNGCVCMISFFWLQVNSQNALFFTQINNLLYITVCIVFLIIFQYIPKQRPTHCVNMLLFNFGGIQLALDDDLVFLFFQSWYLLSFLLIIADTLIQMEVGQVGEFHRSVTIFTRKYNKMQMERKECGLYQKKPHPSRGKKYRWKFKKPTWLTENLLFKSAYIVIWLQYFFLFPWRSRFFWCGFGCTHREK